MKLCSGLVAQLIWLWILVSISNINDFAHKQENRSQYFRVKALHSTQNEPSPNTIPMTLFK